MCVMKCCDCAVVVECAITFHKLLVILDEIFGMVALTVDKYTESVISVGVKMFATGGRGSTNSFVCWVCALGYIFGDILRRLDRLCE